VILWLVYMYIVISLNIANLNDYLRSYLFSSFRRYIITLIYQYSIATYYDAFLQVFRNVVEVHFSI